MGARLSWPSGGGSCVCVSGGLLFVRSAYAIDEPHRATRSAETGQMGAQSPMYTSRARAKKQYLPSGVIYCL